MLTGNFASNAVLVGFLATFATSIIMVLFRARGKAILNQHLFFGKQILGNKVDENKESIFGWLLHLLAGTIIGGIYCFLPIQQGIITAVIYSLIPWALMMAVLFPVFGQGCGGMKLGASVKWQTLLFHLAYGFFLGLFAAL